MPQGNSPQLQYNICDNIIIIIKRTAGAYAGGRSWSGCMMAGSESWGLVGAGGRSFDFFFSLVFFSVLVGGGGRIGYAKKISGKKERLHA